MRWRLQPDRTHVARSSRPLRAEHEQQNLLFGWAAAVVAGLTLPLAVIGGIVAGLLMVLLGLAAFSRATRASKAGMQGSPSARSAEREVSWSPSRDASAEAGRRFLPSTKERAAQA
jgi:hypothetical protein